MERDYKKELSNFAAVWQRVTQGRGKKAGGIKLMPYRDSRRDCRRGGQGWRR